VEEIQSSVVFQSGSKSPPVILSSSNLPELERGGGVDDGVESKGRYIGHEEEGEEEEGEEYETEGSSWSRSSSSHSSDCSAVSACSAGALARAAGTH
jgi:hypothetical protein